jgi:hypothetical protein
MKNTIVFILASILAHLNLYGRDDITMYAKKVAPGETPPAVMDAVNKDFPQNVEAIKVYLNPENMVDTEWGAELNEKIKEGGKAYYTIKMKGEKGGFVYGPYDSNGQLKVMKIEANDVVLPPAIVTAATSGTYEGYQIKSNKYKCYQVIDKNTNKEYVQVSIEKGKDKKTLFFTPSGEFVKDK